MRQYISDPEVIDWSDASDKDCALMNAIINLVTTEEEAVDKHRVNVRHSWSQKDDRGSAGYSRRFTNRRR